MRAGVAVALALALAFVVASGCLGGDKTFPDESDQVRSLHANAYQQNGTDGGRAVIVEVSGLGTDSQERAFAGHIHLALEHALHPEADVQYEPVKTYDADVTAADFSSPTVAYWRTTIPASDLPASGSYRVSANATIQGRTYGASALFAFTA